ncbi:MAG: RNA pyrophosphohydrolase [Rickettsiales bacterium]
MSVKQYRKGVGIVLLNANDQVFVGQRADQSFDAWQMPQGGIDGDEIPIQAALRELEEEVGTNNVKILKESATWLKYEIPSEFVPHFWNGKYVGQEQKWFLAKLLGGEELINIATSHPEFIAYKWVNPSQLVEGIVPFKQDMYRAIVKEFF